MNIALTKFVCLKSYAQALMEISRFRNFFVKANEISSWKNFVCPVVQLKSVIRNTFI